MNDAQSLARGQDYLQNIARILGDLQGTSTVVHELRQNADDAPGATHVRFTVLPDALEVWNDGVFTKCEDVTVYCAVVLDASSRRVVGWSIDSSQTASLVVNALGMAIDNRKAECVVIHRDHGMQFASWAFTRRALDSGLVPSMGSIGGCYDNGQMESFWARMQVELLNRKRWSTTLELANAIFYLEISHNRQRRHSSLGMLSPIEYELRHAETTARNQAS